MRHEYDSSGQGWSGAGRPVCVASPMYPRVGVVLPFWHVIRHYYLVSAGNVALYNRQYCLVSRQLPCNLAVFTMFVGGIAMLASSIVMIADNMVM